MAVFTLDFNLSKQELDSYSVTFYDENDQPNDMVYYVTKIPVKLKPTEMFPSFYMVNRYGEIYSDAQYKLVAYLRVMVADPNLAYVTTSDGITVENYAKNLFHPYWIGGVSENNGQINTGNPNKKNVVRNSSQLFDVIRYGDVGSAVSAVDYVTYGIRNANTKVIKLGGIGEDLIPDSGGLPYGMFIPSTAQWLVFDTDMSASNKKGYFYTKRVNTSGPYSLAYVTPSASNDGAAPFMLPNLFVDHFSWFASYPRITNIAQPFLKNGYRQSGACILTYGVEPV